MHGQQRHCQQKWTYSCAANEHCRQLRDWLFKHGHVLAALAAAAKLYSLNDEWERWHPLQLPVPLLTQLTRLDLSCVKAELPKPWQSVTTHSSGSGRDSPLPLEVVTVTKPSSGSISAASSVISSAAAAALPQLQELQLSHCQLSVQLASQLLGSTTLTKVQWRRVRLFARPDLLQDPFLWLLWQQGPHSFGVHLPQGQALSNLWQQLQLLPKLSELQLQPDKRLTTADLAPLSTLQRLQHLTLGPLDFSPGEEETGAMQLLAALPHLTRLQHVELDCCELHRVQPQQGSGFPALTASTQLKALVLAQLFDVPVPQAAFEYIFPQGRVLPNLKVLHVTSCDEVRPCVAAAQVAKIAASCPARSDLTLSMVTSEGFDVSCLLQLPSSVMSVKGLKWSRHAA